MYKVHTDFAEESLHCFVQFRAIGMMSFPSCLGFIVGKPTSLKLMGIIPLKMKSKFCSLYCSASVCLVQLLSLCYLSIEFLQPY